MVIFVAWVGMVLHSWGIMWPGIAHQICTTCLQHQQHHWCRRAQPTPSSNNSPSLNFCGCKIYSVNFGLLPLTRVLKGILSRKLILLQCIAMLLIDLASPSPTKNWRSLGCLSFAAQKLSLS